MLSADRCVMLVVWLLLFDVVCCLLSLRNAGWLLGVLFDVVRWLVYVLRVVCYWLVSVFCFCVACFVVVCCVVVFLCVV